MARKKVSKPNLVWYILPVFEVIAIFTPASWVGVIGSMIVSILVFVAAITSVVGYFRLKSKFKTLAIVNLIVGIVVLAILIISFIVGLIIGLMYGLSVA